METNNIIQFNGMTFSYKEKTTETICLKEIILLFSNVVIIESNDRYIKLDIS